MQPFLLWLLCLLVALQRRKLDGDAVSRPAAARWLLSDLYSPVVCKYPSREWRCSMSMPKWIERSLEHEQVRFHSRHHRPRFTAQEVAAEEHVSGHRVAKVVIIKADNAMVEVVVPASQRINM